MSLRCKGHNFFNYYSHVSEAEQLRLLEEEQEQLNSSLLALTTHFAQIQFRLKQVVAADTSEKEVSKWMYHAKRSLMA